MSKHKEIEHHLLAGNSITGLEALRLFGVYRLSSVINRLRNKYQIKTVMMEDENGNQYGKYFLRDANSA